MNRPVLIAAHRGAGGGNIPLNTTPAFECALSQRADILEMDVSRSRDGRLFVFHPEMEPVFLGIDRLISEMDAREVEKLRYLNYDHTPTPYGVESLEPVLENLRGRCRINLDKFWTAPREIAALVRRLGMQDQVIIKAEPTPDALRDVEAYAPDLPFLAILREKNRLGRFPAGRCRFLGAELCFATEDAEIAQPAFLDALHEAGYLAWVNAIVYDSRVVLAAGHNDDVSASSHPEAGWGWLADRGFDIIQTDFPLMLHRFLRHRKSGPCV